MSHAKSIKTTVAVAAATFLSTAAFAVDQPPKPMAAEQSAHQTFQKLSADGLKGMQDVRMVRLAIFEGRTADAKKEIEQAKANFAKAKTDKTSFVKAESALKSPSDMGRPGAAQAATDKAATNSAPVSWIPVNGTLALGEDFVATPEKTAGVTKANEHLKKGDHTKAMEDLKLAGINVIFVMEVAPLDKTTSGIDQAAQLIDAGKFYEANQALKGVEDGVRFDVVDMAGTPDKGASASSQKPGTTGTAVTSPSTAPTAAPATK